MILSGFDEISGLPYICQRNGIAIDANDHFLNMTGYIREELIGLDILHILNNILRINKTVESVDMLANIASCFFFNKLMDFKEAKIEVFKSPDSEEVYIFFTQQPLINKNNTLSYTHQLISDNLTGVAIYSADDFTLLKASKEYERLMYERSGQADIIGKKIMDFYIGWWDGPARKGWEEAIQTRKTVYKLEHENVNPITGIQAYYDASVTPILNNDKVKFLVISLNNVTEKVSLKKENDKNALLIKKQKEQLQAILDNMADAIFIIDKDARFIFKNSAALSYFEKDPEKLEDALNSIKFFEKDGREIPYEDLPFYHLLQGKNVSDRVVVVRALNKELYLSINANAILDAKGQFVTGVLASRDITEYMQRDETIKAQQLALLVAEKKEKENLEKLIHMKDEFLALISHEFKTPLTVINSALQTMELLYKDQLTDKVKLHLDKIKQNTYRQVRLVNNLLDITGANEGHLRLNRKNRDIVFITNMIVESVSLYANQKEVNIHFKSDCTVKNIALDEEKYERILLNLLSNAIKFTPRNKNITVELTCQAGCVSIKVMDEGIGIPKEKHEFIFERFGQVDNTYTRQAEGTGIGLYLVKLMVKAMGGQISVDSNVGIGSSFLIELSDVLVENEISGEMQKELIDSRLIQSIAIEFSDIYL